MKKMFTLISVISIMGSGIGAGHSAQQWANTYGGSNEDYPHCIQQTTDGG